MSDLDMVVQAKHFCAVLSSLGRRKAVLRSLGCWGSTRMELFNRGKPMAHAQ